ncbi:MAG: hypothetical protein EON49_16880 [Acidovorax sp.]|nr:MAG: hypothetical protein EON49_16880 [Acidovorax sp.]
MGLQGCATSPMHSYYYGDRAGGISRSDLIETNERAADALLQYAPLDARQPVLVATLVNVDGTYAVSTTVVYISLKLVNPVGNTVVAAHNYAVPMDENVRALLAGR